jgi:glycosyltransferase involved in cell wall biosynthesis
MSVSVSHERPASSAVRAPRVCIISMTRVTQEPRVLRQVATFRQLGWKICVIGHHGGAPAPDDWEFHDMTKPGRDYAELQRRLRDKELEQAPLKRDRELERAFAMQRRRRARVVRLEQLETGMRLRHMLYRDPMRAARILVILMPNHIARVRLAITSRLALLRAWLFQPRRQPVDEPRLATRMTDKAALNYYWSNYDHRGVREYVLPLVSRCDLVIAHDYFTLPLADWLAKRDGARMVVDIHEYAVEQFNYASETDPRKRRDWLYLTRPSSDALQRLFFRKAAAISTVCDGIADLLQRDYQLPKRPTVIRSTPFYEAMPFRPCGETITVLYHGIVSPTRNLDVGVKSVALWRPQFRLVIRGPCDEDYARELKQLARQHGVADRVILEGPVLFADLIRRANEADIGYFAFENFSLQRQFTAPNKFYEYIMAGLAIVVMNTPELAKVVREHGNGVLIDEFSEPAIAAAINRLTPAAIEDMKRRSLAAAKTLCWERESARLIEAYALAAAG